jgi:hypothetical protein
MLSVVFSYSVYRWAHHNDKNSDIIAPNCVNHFQAKGEYSVYSTFQSHEPQFDYLKSLEIEEKINEIQWLKRQNNNLFLLSTNGEYSFIDIYI